MSSLPPLPESRWEPPSEAGAWPAGTRLQGSRRQEEFPDPGLPGAASPASRVPGTGKPAAKPAVPLGSERDGRGGDLAPSLGLLAKRAALAQGRECAGRRLQPITPSPGGKGERRCVPFQGSACILGRRLCLPASVQAMLSGSSCPLRDFKADGGACEPLHQKLAWLLLAVGAHRHGEGLRRQHFLGLSCFSLTALVWIPYDSSSVFAICFPQWCYAFFSDQKSEIVYPFPKFNLIYNVKKINI